MKEQKYSDAVQTSIVKSVEEWGNECKEQPDFEALSQCAKDEFDSIISSFSEMMYSYHLQSPGDWSAAALEEVLVDIFPRKFLAAESFFEATESVLTFFIKYLRQTGIIDAGKTLDLTNRLKKAAPVMQSRAKDKNNFSPMKQLLLEGMEQGIDITDADALNSIFSKTDMTDRLPEKLPATPVRSQKIGRNEPCPCGSGKKYKKCCGFDAPEKSPAAINSTTKSKKHGEEPPTPEQWAQLYEAAINIGKLAPWEHLWDSDLITILLPGEDEPVYCSVMGRNGECFSIGVYPGYESILGYHRIAQSPRDEPPFISLFEQNCLMCHFGNREELVPQDREVLKSLGLKFRGKNQWIYFRSMRPGYYPWFINTEQADILILALQNLVVAYRCLESGELPIDFDGGETLLRFYSEENEMWLNTASKPLPIPVIIPILMVKDELLIARLKSQKKSNVQLEFDLSYLPTPIQERKEDVPYLPRMAMLADKKSGMLLDQHLEQPGEIIEDVILDILCDYIMAHGRPAAIYVRNESVGRFFEDTCEKIGVTLIQDKGVPVINELLSSLLDFMD